jgi:hypothetical protein
MRRQEKVMNEPTKGNGTVYRMFIDDKPYESSQRYLTGAQLREMAHIERQYRIFLKSTARKTRKAAIPRSGKSTTLIPSILPSQAKRSSTRFAVH